MLLRNIGRLSTDNFPRLIFYSENGEDMLLKSRRMRWAGLVARMVEKRNAYRLLVGKPEGKRLLERPRRRWVDNIKLDLLEIGWGGVGWICLAQVESSCECGYEPSGSIKCWETIKWLHNWWPLE
jgi:hypothetical protein